MFAGEALDLGRVEVAGLDASELQLEDARRRLAERIAAGAAEIVAGDADHLAAVAGDGLVG